MRKITVTKKTNFSSAFIILCNTFAVLAAVVGRAAGKNYVENNFYIGGQDAILLGARPGEVLAYGLCLQLLLDCGRTSCGNTINEKINQLVAPCFRYFTVVRPPRQFIALQEQPRNAIEWGNPTSEFCKASLLRAVHYFSAIFVGVAVIGMPIFHMYNGDDLDTPSVQAGCDLYLGMGFLIQLGLFFAAMRSDATTGVTVEEDDAENNENEEVNSADFSSL